MSIAVKAIGQKDIVNIKKSKEGEKYLYMNNKSKFNHPHYWICVSCACQFDKATFLKQLGFCNNTHDNFSITF